MVKSYKVEFFYLGRLQNFKLVNFNKLFPNSPFFFNASSRTRNWQSHLSSVNFIDLDQRDLLSYIIGNGIFFKVPLCNKKDDDAS